MSKTIECFVGAALMLLAFFTSSVLGGIFSGLSFELGAFSMVNVVLCMVSKIFLMAVFIAVYLLISVFVRQRTWLGILGSFMVGMLIPMMTPLNATVMHAGMCLAGGIIFSIGLGAVSKVILQKVSLC